MFSLIKIATSFKEINIEIKSICSVYYVHKLLSRLSFKDTRRSDNVYFASGVEPMSIA